MLIEVDEECLFQNKQFSLQFDSDILDGTSVASTTTNDTQKLIAQDAARQWTWEFSREDSPEDKAFLHQGVHIRPGREAEEVHREVAKGSGCHGEKSNNIWSTQWVCVFIDLLEIFPNSNTFLHLPNGQFGLPFKSRGKETDQLGQIYEYGSRGLRPLLSSVPLFFSAVDVSSAQPWEERPASTVVRRNASTGTACMTSTRARQTHRRQQHTTHHHSVWRNTLNLNACTWPNRVYKKNLSENLELKSVLYQNTGKKYWFRF